jgi:urease accessory protein
MSPAGTTAKAALAATFLAVPSLSLAHTPIDGIGSFYGGMLHPLVVPAHVLLLVGLGLLLGQNGMRHAEAALPAFGLGLLLGLSSAALRFAEPLPAPILLAGAAAGGLLLAASLPLPRALTAVAAVAVGFLLGMDSAPDAQAPGERAMALAGVGLTAILLVIYLVGIAEYCRRPWQRIGIRILGSWIAAIAILSLALAAAGDDARGFG